jgi:transcriptional regulator with XRE-family HTH domain
MTQSALAQEVGCKQSAISMLESGQPEKLSQETLVKIANVLGVLLEAPSCGLNPEPSLASSSSSARGFCPNAVCYSNVPFAFQGELLFWPRLQALSAGGHCAFCGELLEPRCPHCGVAVASDGACCPACGGARVTNTLTPDTDSDAWAAQRRREIAEWRSLLT